MLKTRVITALVLLAILLALLSVNSFPVFAIAATVFFAAAVWESFRLFGSKHPIVGAAVWTAAFIFLAFRSVFSDVALLFVVCASIWAVRLTPSLQSVCHRSMVLAIVF